MAFLTLADHTLSGKALTQGFLASALLTWGGGRIILCGGAALCFLKWSAAALACTHQMSVKTSTVSRYCQMSSQCVGSGICSRLRTMVLQCYSPKLAASWHHLGSSCLFFSPRDLELMDLGCIWNHIRNPLWTAGTPGCFHISVSLGGYPWRDMCWW